MPSRNTPESDTFFETVRHQWDEICAKMTTQRVMHPFLTMEIDDAGSEVCIEAFRVVHEVVDKEGHVRQLNKSG